MVGSMEETGLGQAIGRAEEYRGLKSKRSASDVHVLPPKKPQSKLRAWLQRRRIGLKLWLYMIEGARFVLFYLAFAFVLSYFLHYDQWQEAINIKMLGPGVIG